MKGIKQFNPVGPDYRYNPRPLVMIVSIIKVTLRLLSLNLIFFRIRKTKSAQSDQRLCYLLSRKYYA